MTDHGVGEYPRGLNLDTACTIQAMHIACIAALILAYCIWSYCVACMQDVGEVELT